MNVRILLFYDSASKQIPDLEESLAQISIKFYPLIDRFIQKHHLVDCSDEGAKFIETEAVDVESMDVREMEVDRLNRLLPRQFYQLHESAACPLLSIQATHFRCDGMAIVICVAHSILDGSFSPGRNTAAALNCTSSIDRVSTLLHYFPAGISTAPRQLTSRVMWNISICGNWFLFNNKAIARLRYKLRAGRGEGSGGD